MNIFRKLFGKKQKSKIIMEEDRYYFFNGKCSIKIEKEGLKTNVEKYGDKHTLFTKEGVPIILEKRNGLPKFQVSPNKIKIAGFKAFWISKLNIETRISTQMYYIDCKKFIVQVTTAKPSLQLLSTFRIEK